MIIRNDKNESLAINTDLVSNYFKCKQQNSAKPFVIAFGYAAATSEEPLYDEWHFEDEQERDLVFGYIMGHVGEIWVNQ